MTETMTPPTESAPKRERCLTCKRLLRNCNCYMVMDRDDEKGEQVNYGCDDDE